MKPRNRSRAPMRATPIGSKATTPSAESRERASRNGGAAGQVRRDTDRSVDWDAVIARFLKDMRRRAREERQNGAESVSKPSAGTGTPDRHERRSGDDRARGNPHQSTSAGGDE